MQKSDLISLMETQKFPDEAAFEEVCSLSETYPWSAAFKVLRAIGAKQFDRLDAKDCLNLASVYIGDRTKLYSYTVRKKLLEHIAVSEGSNTGTDVDNEAASELPTTLPEHFTEPEQNKDASHAETPDQVENPEPDDSPISRDPLEAQILSAAVGHLGEMEVEGMLSQNRDEPSAIVPSNDKAEASGFDAGQEDLSSFTRWLNTLGSDVPSQGKKSQPPAADILERFISESPQITPAKAAFFSPSQMGKMSLVEDESFVTETLARIYERQHDYKKAARAYARLGLKYPEKNVYFAALQKQAEEKIKS